MHTVRCLQPPESVQNSKPRVFLPEDSLEGIWTHFELMIFPRWCGSTNFPILKATGQSLQIGHFLHVQQALELAAFPMDFSGQLGLRQKGSNLPTMMCHHGGFCFTFMRHLAVPQNDCPTNGWLEFCKWICLWSSLLEPWSNVDPPCHVIAVCLFLEAGSRYQKTKAPPKKRRLPATLH